MKNLKVIKKFGQREVGDIFEYSEDNKMYVCELTHDNSYYDVATNKMCHAVNTSKDEYSEAYAQKLVAAGYLEPVNDTHDAKDVSQDFVNVFDEMKKLKDKYQNCLDHLEENYEDKPACLKVEEETVMTNMVHLLDYLMSLKK